VIRYVAQRFLALIAVALAATLLVFVALSLVPGDPALLILGHNATPEGLEQVRQEYGLDQPLWKQYLSFMEGLLLHGDLGKSYQRGVPVVDRISEAFPITIILSTIAIIISVIVGGALGLLAAIRANTWVDHVLRVILLTSTSIPIYWLGLLLIYGFAVKYSYLPSFGWGTPRHVVLPALTLATYPMATIGRITRSSMIETLGQDYVRTARSKGLPENLIIMRHALKNALVGIVTVVALQFGILLAGAVLTETVFSVPGMGQLLVNAIFARDHALIRGVVLVGVFVIVTLSFLVDMIYLVIDPRIQYSS
jgi:ABC-type dipeptide/oligopeptide/nickel transport system permease component